LQIIPEVRTDGHGGRCRFDPFEESWDRRRHDLSMTGANNGVRAAIYIIEGTMHGPAIEKLPPRHGDLIIRSDPDPFD
jgi:hypothetical protein